VSLFRPARTVTGPAGYWELYVSKTALPAWKPGSSSGPEPWEGLGSGWSALIELPLLILTFLWSCVLLPLLRFAVVLPVSFTRGRRSRAVRIEAVNPFPDREVLLWTTTDGQVDRVLDEIAAGLAEGKVARPVGAFYSGRETG
jgi:hypothetical protein